MSAIYTIGHSTRPIGEFIATLQAYRVCTVADVRRFPMSRRLPQFNAGALKAALFGAGIAYLHLPELGGRRRPRPDSANTAWSSEGFRGYADYMETEEYRRAMDRLLEIARQRTTVLLCAERLWWRCHRALIADWLKVRGETVIHILDPLHSEHHPFTQAARMVEGRLNYTA